MYNHGTGSENKEITLLSNSPNFILIPIRMCPYFGIIESRWNLLTFLALKGNR